MGQKLLAFLKKRKHCFAWDIFYMPKINIKVITHKHNVDLEFKLAMQTIRKFAPKRNYIINKEMERLDKQWSDQRSQLTNCLTNVVVVRKKNEKPKVCINFKDLNKACLNDSFSLPMINTLVDAAADHELLSFLDA